MTREKRKYAQNRAKIKIVVKINAKQGCEDEGISPEGKTSIYDYFFRLVNFPVRESKLAMNEEDVVIDGGAATAKFVGN